MTKETKEVAKAEKSNAGLDIFKGPRRGFEQEIKQKHLIIPRAKLLQALSPEVVDKMILEGTENEKYESGLIINSLTKEKLPETFIPIFWFENWIRFNPRNKDDDRFDSKYEPGQLIWSSNTDKDPRVAEEANFGPNGEKPLATTFMNFFSIFPGVPMPVIVSFSNTSYKTGRTLLSLCQFSGKADMFGCAYKLSSKQVKRDDLSWYTFNVQKAGFTTKEDFEQCEGLHEQFKDYASDIVVHDLDGEDETTDNSKKPAASNKENDEGQPPF